MTLYEIRREWEDHACVTPLLVVPKSIDGYTSVLVVMGYVNKLTEDTGYVIHRYFPTGANWVCSVDKRGRPLLECLEEVTRQMSEFYPKDAT